MANYSGETVDKKDTIVSEEIMLEIYGLFLHLT